MTPRALVLVAVSIAAIVVYTANLNRAPIYLGNDETEFALQAHAIATTAHDENGRFLPLYFQVVENVWFHPGLFYAIAPLLTVVRPEPWAVRLPVAAVAVLDVLLVFAIARRLRLSDAAAFAASALLIVTPAHVMHGRMACDYILPVPCVLVWLILLIDYERVRTRWRLFAAGAVLGLGLYTYISSIVMMPMYLALSCAVLFAIGERSPRAYAALVAGFALLMLPLAAWLVAVPEVYTGFAQRYRDTGTDVVHNPGGLFAFTLMAQRFAIWRSFFEWTFLFRRAETAVRSSTWNTGVFLEAMAVLISAGVYHILRNRRSTLTVLILVCFLTAPAAASLVNEAHTIDRALVLVPIGALIAAFGVDWLLVRRRPAFDWAARAACVGLAIWMAVEFSDFYRDYMTTYRVRSAFWFDGNHPGAFDPLLRTHPPGDPRIVYLADNLPWIRKQWKLYLIRRGRTDLLAHTVYFTPDTLDVRAVTPGSILLTGAGDPYERVFLKDSHLRVVAQTAEPDGMLTFTRFERIPD